ncbi:MAG TPA: amidohydrolase family protein, partial [Pseudonocardia sp.]|nr:amidohydrolase family protein [Pseudonocardia sp.]
WVGEDKMLYGGDYNIWTPKWQVEGLVDWQMPDEDQFSDYPRLTTDSKKKILGLNAARLYGIDVPAGYELGASASAGDADAPGEELVSGSAGSQA